MSAPLTLYLCPKYLFEVVATKYHYAERGNGAHACERYMLIIGMKIEIRNLARESVVAELFWTDVTALLKVLSYS